MDICPEDARKWYYGSNFLVIVSVPDEGSLYELRAEAARRGIRYAYVHEPDIDNQLTAVALGPGKAAQKLCASLPLALREPAMT